MQNTVYAVMLLNLQVRLHPSHPLGEIRIAHSSQVRLEWHYIKTCPGQKVRRLVKDSAISRTNKLRLLPRGEMRFMTKNEI